MNSIEVKYTNGVSISGREQSASQLLDIVNNDVVTTSFSDAEPILVKFIRFSSPGAGMISGIAHDVDAVHPTMARTTAASFEQVIALQEETAKVDAKAEALATSLDTVNGTLHARHAELTSALAAASSAQSTALTAASTAQTTAMTTADAALQALITALTAEVATLKTGFCPPTNAGRHLLADRLTPIVPPVGCVTAGTPPTTPAAVTNPVSVVTTTLSLSGINPATFNPASVAAALAATAGVNAADVDVVVTDYPVSTTVSFGGVSLTSLTAAATTAITAAIDANLPAAAMVPTLGAVTAAGRRLRRLLDLSFPVSITGVGASTTLAAQTATAVTSPATLAAIATAAGVPSTAVAATPASVSAVMTITVRAASAASAASIATALSPSNTAALTTALASAGVTNTGVAITTPVAAAAPAAASGSSSSSGQDKKDLLALLVLLIIPVANAAYFGGKYLERRRAEKAQAESKAHAVDAVVVVDA